MQNQQKCGKPIPFKPEPAEQRKSQNGSRYFLLIHNLIPISFRISFIIFHGTYLIFSLVKQEFAITITIARFERTVLNPKLTGNSVINNEGLNINFTSELGIYLGTRVFLGYDYFILARFFASFNAFRIQLLLGTVVSLPQLTFNFANLLYTKQLVIYQFHSS